ncbi:HIT domain-containing protein [bacterium]|nr:HIT domain-containing protein [bacterium]
MKDSPKRLWAPWRYEYLKEFDSPKSECFLCDAFNDDHDRERLLLHRSEQTFVIMNLYPYNNGHLLVVPNRHISSLNDLALGELTELFNTVRKANKWLEEVYQPDGFNIGINIGQVAGAGLPGHLHVHIVPRWNGDNNFLPVLGCVKVVSEGLGSSYDQIKKVIEKPE